MLLAPVALALSGAVSSLAAQQSDTALARRIAAVTAIALTEYRTGVAGGKVIAPAEVEEARLFVADARARAAELSPAVRQDVMPWLDTLAAQVAAHRPADELTTTSGQLRAALVKAVGPGLDPLPEQPPSLADGRRVYGERCAACHGSLGRGDGADGKALTPPPANLTDTALGAQTPLDFLRKVSVGVAGTGMPAFDSLLSPADRWAVALYVSSLRFTDAERAAGRGRVERCAECRVFLSDATLTAGLNDDSLAARLAAWLSRDSTSRAVVAYGRTAGAAEQLGGDRRLQAARVVDRVGRGVDEATRLAQQGQRSAAASRATDAYLEFERIETAVSARDARLTKGVEQAVGSWRAALASGDSAAMWGRAAEVHAALGAALSPLLGTATAPVLFSQSLVIIVREGLEAILIVAALTALLAKAGAPERKKEVGWGVVAALAASLATAAVLAAAVRRSVAQREALEGATMLVAAAVLFWVSYWLVSKIEVKKWTAFVSQQLRRALEHGGGLALAFVAFLAVYREGFETVLFYAALVAAADGVAAGTAAIAGGIGVGLAILGVVYLVIQRYGVRLPLKQFFGVTSALLYAMAFSFSGQGIADLQEAGWISTTPLGWAPSLPFLGVFPTVETLAAQTLLVVAVLVALTWIFWVVPRREAAAS